MKADRANYLARFILPFGQLKITQAPEKTEKRKKPIIVFESELPLLHYSVMGRVMKGTIERLRLTMINGKELVASFEPPLKYEDGKLILDEGTSMRLLIEKSSSGESDVANNFSADTLYEDLKIKIQQNLSGADLSNISTELENDFPEAFVQYLKLIVFTKENNQEFNKFVEAISIIYKNKENISLDDVHMLGNLYKTKTEKLIVINNSLMLSLSNVKSILKVEDLNTLKIKSTTRTADSMNEIRQLLQEHYKYFKMFLFERSA